MKRTQIKNISNKIKEIDKLGKLIVIFGNGGSAADSQHFAGELMCTYKNKNRKPFRLIIPEHQLATDNVSTSQNALNILIIESPKGLQGEGIAALNYS